MAAAEAKDPRRLGLTAVKHLTSRCVFDQWSKFEGMCLSSESFVGLEGVREGEWERQAWAG